MTIETQFDPSDHVWVIQGSGIHKATIESVSIDSSFEKTNIKYKLSINGRKSHIQKDESEIWSALEALVSSVAAQE